VKHITLIVVLLLSSFACEQGSTLNEPVTLDAGSPKAMVGEDPRTPPDWKQEARVPALDYLRVTPDWSVGCDGQVQFRAEICTGRSNEGAPPYLFVADECYGFYPDTNEMAYDSTAIGDYLNCMCNFYSTEILDIDDYGISDGVYSVRLFWYSDQEYEDWICDFQREWISCGGQGGKTRPGQD